MLDIMIFGGVWHPFNIYNVLVSFFILNKNSRSFFWKNVKHIYVKNHDLKDNYNQQGKILAPNKIEKNR